jgi:hypothetical protein
MGFASFPSALEVFLKDMLPTSFQITGMLSHQHFTAYVIRVRNITSLFDAMSVARQV